jgi:hypothetical protein
MPLLCASNRKTVNSQDTTTVNDQFAEMTNNVLHKRQGTADQQFCCQGRRLSTAFWAMAFVEYRYDKILKEEYHANYLDATTNAQKK